MVDRHAVGRLVDQRTATSSTRRPRWPATAPPRCTWSRRRRDDCGAVANTATGDDDERGSAVADASRHVDCANIDIDKDGGRARVTAGDQIGFTVTLIEHGRGRGPRDRVHGRAADRARLVDRTGVRRLVDRGRQPGLRARRRWRATTTTAVHVVATTDAGDCGDGANTAAVTTTNDGSDGRPRDRSTCAAPTSTSTRSRTPGASAPVTRSASRSRCATSATARPRASSSPTPSRRASTGRSRRRRPAGRSRAATSVYGRRRSTRREATDGARRRDDRRGRLRPGRQHGDAVHEQRRLGLRERVGRRELRGHRRGEGGRRGQRHRRRADRLHRHPGQHG